MQRVRMYTTYDIGRFTGTDPTTVHKWIDRGLLKGFRTPGGHRRVAAKDLKAFLVSHGMPVPEELRGANDVRLLLVGDARSFPKNLATSVKKSRPSWEVEVSDDGYQALLLVPTFSPTVMVIDLLMAGMDGMSVIRSVKLHLQTAHVVAVSAKTSRETEKKVRAAGATALVGKPLTAAMAIEAVERAHNILAPREPARV